jgi:arginase
LGAKVTEYGPWGGAATGEGKPDTVILGVPYDAMSTNRRGAAQGPGAIRRASSSRSINPCTEEGHSLCEVTRLADRGDLAVPDDPAQMAEAVYKAAAEIIAEGATPVVIGGDHSITPSVVQAVAEKHGKIDILYMDAHPDLYESYEGNPYSHGSTGYRIAKTVGFGKFLQVGVRMPAKGHMEKAAELGIRVITAYHLVAPEDLRFENPVYLSLDLDCLDPAFAPAVGNPVPGGLSTRELLDVLKSISGRSVGADVVELVPPYDVSDVTAAAAARFVMEIAGLIAGVR